MLENEKPTKKLAVLGGILVLLLALGSLFDYEISSFLYPGVESAYGKFFAAFGELPAFLTLGGSGAILIVRRGKSTKFKDVFWLCGGVALVGVSAGLTFAEIHEDLPKLPIADAAVITLCLFAAICVAALYLTRNASRKVVFRFLMTTIFVCIGTMAVINLVKIPWGRPRLRLLLRDSRAVFAPWWVASTAQKKALMALGVSADDFRSFPSGHTATAACSLLWMLLPELNERFCGKGRYLFAGSIVWTGVIALSRLTMGAHFLSDIAVSWLFTYLLFVIAMRLFQRDCRFYDWCYDLMT